MTEARVSEFTALLQKHPDGLTQELIEQKLSLDTTEAAELINLLLKSAKVQLFNVDGKFVYRAASHAETQWQMRIQNLGKEERLVLQLVENAGNQGLWKRELGRRSNITGHRLTKIVNRLESMKLIKHVKTVTSKNKLLYMRYDVEPDRKLLGGPWYTPGMDLDLEFIDQLCKVCFQYTKTKTEAGAFVTLEELTAYISQKGITKVRLQTSDVQELLSALIYDGKLDLLPDPRLMHDGEGEPKYIYRPSGFERPPDGLSEIPCAQCQKVDICMEGSEISPSLCPYMNKWLEF